MTYWVWPSREVIIAVHEMQLAEHGGLVGVRDVELMDSALSCAPNLVAYGQPDAAALAAAYGWGLSRNHPFMDGNKRTGFVAAELFLNLNGYELVANDADCVITMLGVAAGDVSEEAFATSLRNHIVPPHLSYARPSQTLHPSCLLGRHRRRRRRVLRQLPQVF